MTVPELGARVMQETALLEDSRLRELSYQKLPIPTLLIIEVDALFDANGAHFLEVHCTKALLLVLKKRKQNCTRKEMALVGLYKLTIPKPRDSMAIKQHILPPLRLTDSRAVQALVHERFQAPFNLQLQLQG